MKKLILFALLVLPLGVWAQSAAVKKIMEMSREDNRVMEHLDVLCNRFGGRLVGSAGFENSQAWIVKQLEEWGIVSLSDRYAKLVAGTVTATGGSGAGIGGGSGSTNGSGTNITISGGTVTATASGGGACIGGGVYGAGTNIIISGGTVTAIGSDGSIDSFAIGGGFHASTKESIFISPDEFCAITVKETEEATEIIGKYIQETDVTSAVNSKKYLYIFTTTCGGIHIDEDVNHKCDVCDAYMDELHTDEDGDHKCDVCDADLSAGNADDDQTNDEEEDED